MASVTLDTVTRRYGGTVALDELSLSVNDGELFVVLGPSGSGKTTLLRTVAGLESVTEGEVTVGGEQMEGVAPKDRDIAMVFQDSSLYPHLDVQENLAFPLRIRQASNIPERVEIVADTLDIEDLLTRDPSGLSGGERQRVALGKALIRDPGVFLMDEPLSSLDSHLHRRLRREIQELHASVGTTTIYVTHDHVEAMSLADRVCVMRDGRVEQVGTPEEVYASPCNVFVADFVAEHPINTFDDTEEVVTGALDVTPQEGLLSVRPEHLTINKHGPFEATPVLSERYGNTTVIHAAFRGDEICITTNTGMDLEHEFSFDIDEEGLRWLNR